MKTLIFLISLTVALFAQEESENDYIQKTLVKVGENAPEFVGNTIKGEKFSLTEQKGKVVLITFFATWCPHCLAELPQIEDKIYKVLKDRKDFELIVFGRKHSVEELVKFKEAKNINVPFAEDPKGEIYGKYAEKYIPRAFVVGKDGKIKMISKGTKVTSVEDIFKVINNELEKK